MAEINGACQISAISAGLVVCGRVSLRTPLYVREQLDVVEMTLILLGCRCVCLYQHRVAPLLNVLRCLIGSHSATCSEQLSYSLHCLSTFVFLWARGAGGDEKCRSEDPPPNNAGPAACNVRSCCAMLVLKRQGAREMYQQWQTLSRQQWSSTGSSVNRRVQLPALMTTSERLPSGDKAAEKCVGHIW